jgi:hypothetical protein
MRAFLAKSCCQRPYEACRCSGRGRPRSIPYEGYDHCRHFRHPILLVLTFSQYFIADALNLGATGWRHCCLWWRGAIGGSKIHLRQYLVVCRLAISCGYHGLVRGGHVKVGRWPEVLHAHVEWDRYVLVVTRNKKDGVMTYVFLAIGTLQQLLHWRSYVGA